MTPALSWPGGSRHLAEGRSPTLFAADRAHRIVCRLADCEEGEPIRLFDLPEPTAGNGDPAQIC